MACARFSSISIAAAGFLAAAPALQAWAQDSAAPALSAGVGTQSANKESTPISEPTKAPPDPYGCRDAANKVPIITIKTTTERIDQDIERAKAMAPEMLACHLLTKAEILKRAGTYMADQFYLEAIKADERWAATAKHTSEAAYELIYADYLRKYRGANGPLLNQAEQHYVVAQHKHAQQVIEEARRQDIEPPHTLGRCQYPEKFDGFVNTCRNIQRGLAFLYERDGQPLIPWDDNTGDEPGLRAFFSSLNTFGDQNSDFQNVDDARGYTAEALFAEGRLNRQLSQRELESIARDWYQGQTINRLRLRYRDLPSLDLIYGYQYQSNARISNVFEPEDKADIKQRTYGIALEKPFHVRDTADVTLGAAYRYLERQGIVEFRPEKTEDINEIEINAAISPLISADSALGPGKLTLDLTYVYQDIDPEAAYGGDGHDRSIYGATLSYLWQQKIPWLGITTDAFGQLYGTRGLETSFGYAHDVEQYGKTDAKKDDFFFGISWLGVTPFSEKLPWSGEKPLFDFTIQPTIFTAEVDGDDRNILQYRTNLTTVFTIFDEDRGEDGRPRPLHALDVDFLKLAVPVRHDIGIEGGDHYENVRFGVALNAKLTSYWLGGTTFLASIGYDYQNFYEIDKDLHLFRVALSMGF